MKPDEYNPCAITDKVKEYTIFQKAVLQTYLEIECKRHLREYFDQTVKKIDFERLSEKIGNRIIQDEIRRGGLFRLYITLHYYKWKYWLISSVSGEKLDFMICIIFSIEFIKEYKLRHSIRRTHECPL